MSKELTDKRKLFIAEYLKDLNATRAAIAVGYSEKSAYSQGQRLLKKVEIQEKIQEEIEKRQERLEVSQDKILKELVKIAFSDITNYVMVKDGVITIQDTETLDEDKARAIESIKQTQSGGKAVKLYDKIKALELLGRHFGLFNANNSININNEVKAQTMVNLSNLSYEELNLLGKILEKAERAERAEQPVTDTPDSREY